jgi:hypothetical protein
MSVPRFPEMVVGVENRTIDDPWSVVLKLFPIQTVRDFSLEDD